MSAPTSRDPLFVNTAGGQCWKRQHVDRDGNGLYALADVVACPAYVLASFAELAELGIVGSADVLPMPAGPESKPLALTEEQIEALVAAGDRVVNDAVHKDLCACDAWPEKCVSTGHYFMGAWDVSGLDTALPAVLGLWEQMRGGELAALRAEVASLNESLTAAGERLRADAARIAELEAQRERRRVRLVALSNDALNMRGSLSPMGEGRKVPFPLGETLTPAVDWLIGRVAELEARPSPADVLRQAADDLTAACPDHSDADEAWMDCPCEFADELRRKAGLSGSGDDGAGCACPSVDRLHQVGCPLDGVPGPDERPVNGLTRTFSPVASLREDEPAGVPCSKCGGPVHWVKSTNSDGGFWRHNYVPGRFLDHFGQVAGVEGRHGFEREHLGESEAKRRLARCKHCGQDRKAPMHAEPEGEHYPHVHHEYRPGLGRDLPEAGEAR